MEGLVIAAMGGLSAFFFMRDSRQWFPGVIGIGSFFFYSPWITGAILPVTVAWAFYSQAVSFEKQRDYQEQQAETFLRRLSQILPFSSSLNLALSEIVSHGGGTGESDSVLQDIARTWDVEAIRLVAQAAVLVKRHGGSLQDVVNWSTRKITRDRRRRFTRQAEETSKRMTILLLAAVPLPLVMMFWIIIPKFYIALTTTLVGHITLVISALLDTGIVSVLAGHVWKGAQIR